MTVNGVRPFHCVRLLSAVRAAVMLAAALLALPSSAFAASFSAAAPAVGTTVTASPAVVSVSASSATPILGTPVMTIDGQAVPVTVAYTVVVPGYWEYDPDWDEDYWVPPVYDYTRATVSGSPGMLRDGQRTAQVMLPSGAGTYSWSFGVSETPVLGALTPTSGTTTTTAAPAVTVKATDNSAVTTWSATIDGVAVAAAYDAPSQTLRLLPAELANFASHTASVTVADALGNSAARNWTFTISSPVTTWSGEYPARDAVMSTVPWGVSTNLQCTSPFLMFTRKMWVDGVSVPMVIWLNQVPSDPTRAQMIGYPASAGRDGTHTVLAQVSNLGGTMAMSSWSFAVRVPPTLGTPAPAAGSTVTTVTPVILVPASDNSAVTSVSATVNGASAAASFDAGTGKVRVTPASALPDDAVSTVTVSAFDALGLRRELTWSFEVEVGQVMGGDAQDCERCHPGIGADPDMSPWCEDCHPAQHSGAPSSYHGRADITNCRPCHVSVLLIEHSRPGITCTTCHDSANATVGAAIATGDSQCSSCHDGHGAQHVNTMTTCGGVDCHNGTTLTSVHKAVGCVCHNSTDARVSAAIAANNRDCTACHNPVVIHGAVHNADTSYKGYVSALGSGGALLACTSCHRTNLLADHGSDYTNCPTCHASGAPRSSFSVWDKTCQTGACHPVTGTINGVPVAPHPAPTVPMDHHVVASGYQAPPYCNQCHNSPAPQCGAQYGCHANVVPPATTVDYKPPMTIASQISSEPIVWMLNATDVGDGVTATYYSFDDAPFALYGDVERENGITNPADASPPYAHTLRYYSVDAAGNTEVIQTRDYNVTDSTAPTITFNGVQLGAELFAAKSLTMSVVDPKVGGFSTGVAFIHTEVRTFKTNWGWFPYQAFYQPMSDFSYPLDGTWDADRNITAVENYAIAKSQPGYWPTYQDFGGGSGRFEFQYYARDFTGNQTPVGHALIYIDNTAPVSTAATVTPGVFLWKLNASDNLVSVAGTYYSFDGAPFAPYTAADASTGVANAQPGGNSSGTHVLSFYSVDALGNTETPKSISYTVP